MAGRCLYRGTVRKVFQCALMAASLSPVMAWAAPQWIVEAGRWDRVATPVQVDLDLGSVGDAGLELVSEAGVAVPVQREPDGTYWFVVRDLPRGTKRAYTLRTGAAGAVAVTATRAESSVRLELRGREVFTYRTSPTEFPGGRPDLTPAFRRGAYIHPVLTPMGVQVTDDYPAKSIEVRVRIEPHHFVERSGLDITLKIPVTVHEAMTGAEIEVPTLRSPVRIRIPTPWTPGGVVKLAGQGVRGPSGKSGDIFVKTFIVLPEAANDAARQASLVIEESYTGSVRRHVPLLLDKSSK